MLSARSLTWQQVENNEPSVGKAISSYHNIICYLLMKIAPSALMRDSECAYQSVCCMMMIISTQDKFAGFGKRLKRTIKSNLLHILIRCDYAIESQLSCVTCMHIGFLLNLICTIRQDLTLLLCYCTVVFVQATKRRSQLSSFRNARAATWHNIQSA